MNDHTLRQVHGLINSVIMVSEKFINKVETGRARSVETYSDLQKLRAEAELLKNTLSTSASGEGESNKKE